MIPLNSHIANLNNLISASIYSNEWSRIYEWLLIAGSIESIKLDTSKNQPYFGWCSAADEYDTTKEILLQCFVRELSIFHFIWGALESAIDLVKPDKQPGNAKKEKIADTCYMLAQNYSTHPMIAFLFEETELFEIKSRRCFGFEKVQQRFSKIKKFGVAGIGLYAVYELRNLFAHGAMSFPAPNIDNAPESPYISLVSHASRIVLLTIQTLLLQKWKCKEIAIFDHTMQEETSLDLALRSCHLEQDKYLDQLQLI